MLARDPRYALHKSFDDGLVREWPPAACISRRGAGVPVWLGDLALGGRPQPVRDIGLASHDGNRTLDRQSVKAGRKCTP